MIINDDCLNAMRKMEDNSIDFIITDPPYGLHFMGKDWDKFKKTKFDESGDHKIVFENGKKRTVRKIGSANHEAGSYDPKRDDEFQEFMRQVGIEMLRIIKPGGMLAMFGAPRRHHRQMSGLEDAGWEIRDVMMWLFGQGFPKSHNHFGIEGYGTALKPAYEPIILAMKPLDGTYKQNVEKWGIGGINIDGSRIAGEAWIRPSRPNIRGGNYCNSQEEPFPRSNNKGRWPANIILDEFYEQILTLKNNIPNGIIDVILEYFYDYDLPNLPKRNQNISKQNQEEQSTVLQQELLLQGIEQSAEGREPFHVGKKTQRRINSENETTPHQERMGQSSIQRSLDVTRIPLPEYSSIANRSTDSCEANVEQGRDIRTSFNDGIETRKTPKELGSSSSYEWSEGRQQNGEFGGTGQLNSQERTQRDIERIEGIKKGKRRIEILACDIPEKWMKYFEETGQEMRSHNCAAALLDEQSGVLKSGSGNRRPNGGGEMFGGFSPMQASFEASSGGASRFFYMAKASSKERNKGLEGMPLKERGNISGNNHSAYCTSCEKTYNHTNDHSQCKGEYKTREAKAFRNSHPTVKPISLMKYIITLLAPPNNPTLLDPFAGSGSTLVAAAELGIKAIGIEKEAEYCEIARKRVAAVDLPLFKFGT